MGLTLGAVAASRGVKVDLDTQVRLVQSLKEDQVAFLRDGTPIKEDSLQTILLIDIAQSLRAIAGRPQA